MVGYTHTQDLPSTHRKQACSGSPCGESKWFGLRLINLHSCVWPINTWYVTRDCCANSYERSELLLVSVYDAYPVCVLS